jgi:hypothetical protein
LPNTYKDLIISSLPARTRRRSWPNSLPRYSAKFPGIDLKKSSRFSWTGRTSAHGIGDVSIAIPPRKAGKHRPGHVIVGRSTKAVDFASLDHKPPASSSRPWPPQRGLPALKILATISLLLKDNAFRQAFA